LTAPARAAWRWRIVYLRALIDRELWKTHGKLEGKTPTHSLLILVVNLIVNLVDLA
jgi:hypothetical protein